MYYLGIDLGGTNIAAAAVSETGEILGRSGTPTPRSGAADVAKAMAEMVIQAASSAGLPLEGAAAVGIGTPGTIDPVTGTVIYWSNLDFNNVPLVELVKAHLPVELPVLLENDANAAALGEFVAGAGREGDSMVAITLGTGVGGGAVFQGKLFTGFNYAGMEVGHFVLQEGGQRCTCGRQGCFEAYCSATALIRMTREAMAENTDSLLWKLCDGDINKINGRHPFQGKDQGDATATAVVDSYIRYLASGVTSLVNILQPEIFCIGGGVANQKENLLNPLYEIFDREDYARNGSRRTKIICAQLGNDAGIVGAALLPKFQ